MAKKSWTLLTAALAIGSFAIACSESAGPAGVVSFVNDGISGAAVSETIDFENEMEGAVDPSVMGDGGSGPITTSATGCEDVSIIYDTASGNPADPDLNVQSQQGKVLVIEEDLFDMDGDGDPDDCASGGTLTLDFSGVNAAGVELVSIVVLDIEDDVAANKIELFGPGDVLLNTVQIPVTGDGGITVPPLDLGPTAGVTKLVASFNTSGAIDNIVFTPPMGGTEGCTPGKWKNWTGQGRQADIWPPTGYMQDDTVESVFTGVHAALVGTTLLEALDGGGGPGVIGKQKILLRAAVAALLNATHPAVDYPLTEAQVIAMVDAALAGSQTDMTDLATELDTFNNLGCPGGDLSD